MGDYHQIVTDLRRKFDTGRTKDIIFRLNQLKSLERLYEENTEALLDALEKDLRKPKFEGYMYEVLILKRDIKKVIKHLRKWTKPRKLPKNLISLSDNVSYDYQPHGVVLMIGPWNYPIHVTLLPLAGAIAAGCCVLIKPSEVSGNCSAILTALLPKYLDQECYKIIQADSTETQKLLKEKFDFIFFTGSTHVGKIIYSQAALSLTPVCLELGGKSPVYIDDSANIRMAAERIIWAKCICLGQTCVAPDYILCSKEVQIKFIEEAKKALLKFYGQNIQESPDLSRIINKRHFDRLRKLLNETRSTVALGGFVDEYDLFISPTVLVDVDENEPVMTEEIFGPILPIITARNVKDAVDFVKNRPNPLALYVFSTNKKVVKTFLERTNSGGVCINDALYHSSVPDLPFGGLSESGLGQYHGKFSFKTFSRPRSICHRSFNSFEDKFGYGSRYPPYTPLKFKMMEIGFGNHDLFYIRAGFLPYVLCFLLGLLVMHSLSLLFGLSASDSPSSV